ncbi:TPA: hypothetical protein U1629_000185 [Streptococcus suis]|nr:hypothetical protein [Streptococcus suis]NQP14249.1 hypothetical protein [Streptococcus suis]HEM5429142.1 hypothetical protein [Streptococcus suis]
MVVPKFRAWDTFDEDMVNDIFFSWQDCGYESLNECLSDERWKFMQSTGVFDKNGQEIFEGDKIIYNRDDYTVVRIDAAIGLAFIKNGEKTSFKPLVDGMINFDRVEVIGNIYENPELLEHPDFREG